ncbi:MAG TPA: translation elongation factor Ts, partial [Coxiellaceae bacterium]|nr:translation elongation factor Ts [Coxiellaceae bacterium]
MSISASDVKELRERTGAGMMECKKALEKAGSIEDAIVYLRETGLAKADKRANKLAAEGVVVVAQSTDGKTTLMMEANCQTDFVARGQLGEFAQEVVDRALQEKVDTVEALAEMALESGNNVEYARRELVNKSGENIQLRRLAKINTPHIIGTYVHGKRIGVIVELEGGDSNLAKDIAMHIAASNPKALRPEDVPAELVEGERQIFMTQAAESGKAPEIAAKMVEGRIKKFLGENSLLGQPFVKNPDQTVADLVKAHNATIKSFVRFEVGEGMEKEQVDFAAE